VPIIHMNVRYFEVLQPGKPDAKKICWFGGGIDLTPHYIIKEDASWFHRQLKKVCDLHHSAYYPDFKKWADDYFFIRHRNETRGIGGIFFDKLAEVPGIPLQQRFDFVQAVGNSFTPVYSHLVLKNKDIHYTENEKRWQFVRRGRYVEFNLVYDRGTRFGLETNGRTESILLSMPPRAEWLYDYTPISGSLEENTLFLLKKGINWAE
ncbi:MAG TPA: coproporphyrinogen III oxidase, partial [Bacteroidia bacterium]